MSDKKPLKMLLIEDSEEDEFLLLRHLKKGGYKVSHRRVETAEAMREALIEGGWDLIISDYSLPQFSGLGALQLYQELDCDLPCIIVSGTIGEETAVRALQSGAHDFILKGKYARLLPAIEREMREHKGRQARRQAERRLVESERRFRSLIENALDIITVIDAEGTITYASPAVSRVLGSRPDEVIGRKLADLVHEEDRRLVAEVLERAVGEPEKVHHAVMRHRHRDGGWRVLESIGRNLLGDPSVSGIVVNSRDITERENAERALLKANARLTQALAHLEDSQAQAIQQERLRALGEMASGVAHDFNNALASVLGFSEALLMYPELLDDKEQTIEFLQMMNTAAQDGAEVVARLAEFYRHREKLENFEPLDLSKVADQTVQLTQPKWKGQALAAGVEVQVQRDFGDIPLVQGNEQELRQALTNLIFNAVDAMPEGGTLTLRTRATEEHVVLEIADSGTGMTEETKTRCLEPFFTTKGQKGTGMGLSMVYGIIRRHQGWVEIDSTLGEGTTFRLTFPIELSAESIEGEVCLESEDHSGRSLHTLVVESEPMVLKVIATYLVCDGHQVEFAASGNEGLKLLQQMQDIDLVVTAEALPELSGPQLAQKVKQKFPDLPVILMTSLGAESEKPDGVDVVLAKPFTLSKFRAATREATGR